MRGSRADARKRRHHRVRKTMQGSATRPRLAVFKSNKYIYAQLIDDDGGTTLAAASSAESGFDKTTLTAETAAEVGKLIAARARDAGVDVVVFDRGGFPYHGRIKALADAAREGGLKF